MAASRSSSERSGSINMQDSPKMAFQSKADPNMALYEAQPSKFPARRFSTELSLTFFSGFEQPARYPQLLLPP